MTAAGAQLAGLAGALALFFWSQVVPLAIEAALLLLAAGLVDRLLPVAVWPELRLAAGSVLLLKLVLPPGWAGSPLSYVSWGLSWPLPPPEAVADPAWRNVAIGVAVAWLAGVIAGLGLLLWRHRRLERIWREAQPAGEELERVLLAAAARLGLSGAPPPLRLASGLASPCVFGLFRPRILAPPDLEPRQAEHALLHELAHVRRGDLFFAACVGLLRVVYFFHPLVHLAGRRLEGLRELCCDRVVARRLGEERVAYRQTLLAIAARRHRGALEALAFAGRSSLLERLRALERAEKDRPLLRRLLTSLAMALALACAVPLAPPVAAGAAQVAQMIDKPPGCLQLRFLVMEQLAREQRASDEPTKEPK